MNKAKPWLAGVLLIVATVVVWRSFFAAPPEMGEAVAARHEALEMLAQHLVQAEPGGCALVLSNPFAQEMRKSSRVRQFEEAGLSGLRAGLGEALSMKVVHPEIKPEFRETPEKAVFPSDTQTPLSFLMMPESVDQLAADQSECSLIVSLIGLPVGVETLNVWRGEQRFALLLPDLRLLGSKSKVVQAFQKGKIVAAVVDDPGGDGSLVVHQGNVQDVINTHPNVFGFKRRKG